MKLMAKHAWTCAAALVFALLALSLPGVGAAAYADEPSLGPAFALVAQDLDGSGDSDAGDQGGSGGPGETPQGGGGQVVQAGSAQTPAVPYTAKLYIKGKENYKYAYQVLSKVNAERKKRGLGALTMDRDLLKAAMQRAAETALVFSHTRPDATMCFSASDKMYGENIAAGQTSAASVMKSWMNSPGHKANILTEDYRSIGIGCFVADGHYYWVQAFGYGKADAVSQPKNKTVSHAVIYDQAIGKLKFKIKIGSVKKGRKAAAKIVCTNSFFKVTIQPKSFKFSSSKKKVASVNSKGKVKGKKRGKAKIVARAKSGTLKVSKTVRVK